MKLAARVGVAALGISLVAFTISANSFAANNRSMEISPVSGNTTQDQISLSPNMTCNSGYEITASGSGFRTNILASGRSVGTQPISLYATWEQIAESYSIPFPFVPGGSALMVFSCFDGRITSELISFYGGVSYWDSCAVTCHDVVRPVVDSHQVMC